MKLSELGRHREELEEEFLDFIVPTGYVPHVPQLDELIERGQPQQRWHDFRIYQSRRQP